MASVPWVLQRAAGDKGRAGRGQLTSPDVQARDTGCPFGTWEALIPGTPPGEGRRRPQTLRLP